MLIEALVLRQLRPLSTQVKGIPRNHRPRLLTKTVKSCVNVTKERNILLKTARTLWCDSKEFLEVELSCRCSESFEESENGTMILLSHMFRRPLNP